MHLGGWLGERYQAAENKVNHTLKHYDQVLRSHGAPDFYIGATSANDGMTWSPKIQINTNNQYKGQPQANKPKAYSANAAKTASSIKQGGMTKDEIQDFNIKHPNETAIRGNE